MEEMHRASYGGRVWSSDAFQEVPLPARAPLHSPTGSKLSRPCGLKFSEAPFRRHN